MLYGRIKWYKRNRNRSQLPIDYNQRHNNFVEIVEVVKEEVDVAWWRMDWSGGKTMAESRDNVEDSYPYQQGLWFLVVVGGAPGPWSNWHGAWNHSGCVLGEKRERLDRGRTEMAYHN